MPTFRFLILSGIAASGLATSALATITLQMTVTGSGYIASNFANAAGVAINGMNWGIVVDTGGTTGVFSLDSYVPFNIATAGFLSTASGVTDDYYVPATSTVDSTGFFEVGGTIQGGPGTITQINGVPYGGGTGIDQNQKFALIWFSTNTASTVGDKYGFFTDPALTIPAESVSPFDRSAPFAGNDPPRAANHSIAAVPEPSSLLFLAAGTALLLRRRIRR